MTSPEVRARIDAGATTVIVPIGGTEQNGPHMVLGKHNVRVRLLAGLIAERLGDTLVAPVLAYVPEGNVNPPQAHMRYAGTLSVPGPVFEAVLNATADSLCQHGFRHIVLIGDHGGYQSHLQRVAKHRAGQSACKVHAVTEFYRAAQQPFAAWLAARGYSADEIGQHAGLADTSLALALDPELVRSDRLQAAGDGVQGDPRRASAALGREGVAQIVDRTVRAVRASTGSR